MILPFAIHDDYIPSPANEPTSCLYSDFIKRQPLGKGGDSKVYEVILEASSSTPMRAAFKEYKKDAEPFFEDEKQIHLMLHHPNIIKLLYVVEKPQSPCYGLVIELAVQGTLHDYVNHQLKNAPDHQSILMRIFYEIYAALTYVHAQRVIHADVKESNVLMAEDGQGVVAKLADFSLSLKLGAEENEVILDSSRGSIGYNAPELTRRAADGKYHFTTAVDIWSASVMCVNVMRRKALNLEKPCKELMAFMNRSNEIEPGKRPFASDGQALLSKLRM